MSQQYKPPFLRWLVGLIAGFLSFVYLVGLNLVQMACFPVYFISKPLWRAINRWCCRSIWGLWVLFAERLYKIEIRFVGDQIKPGENSLVLPNHQSMADVMVLLCFAWRCGRVGDAKFFVKEIVKYIPGVGWGMYFIDCIFVKRNWTRDRSNIEKLFGKYRRENIPMFLVSFLEGTRSTPDKLAESQKFARERGLYVPQHTLVPRTKGLVATVQGLRGHLDSVYDLTVGYQEDPPPALVQCFESKVRRIDIHVKRYNMEEIPRDEQELADWAFACFREKDSLMAHFSEFREFPGAPSAEKRVRVRDWLSGKRHRLMTTHG